ncbi:MAG: hypothetical protein IH568_02380 [Burkholderiaceae bacterium]|nr:hypothetical protein [Burkholderiaceae bacterium]
MPTNKPRLTLTLEPEVAAAVDRLARLQGCPKSRVLTELLAGLGPILTKVADTLELAMRAQAGAKEGLRRAVDQAEAELQPMVAAVIAAYDGLGQQIGEIAERLEGDGEGQRCDGAESRRRALAPAVEPSRSRKDPRPVTTGVTHPKRGAKQQPQGASPTGCLCTYTDHERQENRACPVHFPEGVIHAL